MIGACAAAAGAAGMYPPARKGSWCIVGLPLPNKKIPTVRCAGFSVAWSRFEQKAYPLQGSPCLRTAKKFKECRRTRCSSPPVQASMNMSTSTFTRTPMHMFAQMPIRMIALPRDPSLNPRSRKKSTHVLTRYASSIRIHERLDMQRTTHR